MYAYSITAKAHRNPLLKNILLKNTLFKNARFNKFTFENYTFEKVHFCWLHLPSCVCIAKVFWDPLKNYIVVPTPTFWIIFEKVISCMKRGHKFWWQAISEMPLKMKHRTGKEKELQPRHIYRNLLEIMQVSLLLGTSWLWYTYTRTRQILYGTSWLLIKLLSSKSLPLLGDLLLL